MDGIRPVVDNLDAAARAHQMVALADEDPSQVGLVSFLCAA